MSKLFVAVLAFSAVSLAIGGPVPGGFGGLGSFVSDSKIKPLSDPSVKGAYPGDDTNYTDLLKALAAIQEPISVDKVKEVLKGHAAKLYQRVEAAEKAYENVRDSIGNADAKNFVAKVGELIEKYYLVGLHINEQAKAGEEIQKLYSGLNAEGQKVAGEKLQEAAKAVEKALYKP